jgi:PAS domain S-box-containing protein
LTWVAILNSLAREEVVIADETLRQAEPENLPQDPEDWARTFIKHSPAIIWACDTQGQITFANDAACRFFEYDRATLLTYRMTDLIEANPATSLDPAHAFTRFLTQRTATFRTRAGSTRTAGYSLYTMHDLTGEPIGYQIFLDPTDQQQTLLTLKQRNEELAALNAIADILSNPLHLAHALDHVCEQIVSITGMESAAICLIDESQQYVDIVAHRGISPELYQEIRHLGLDDPITRYVAKEGNVFAIDDLTTYQGNGIAGPRAAGYRAGIAVPIFKRNTPVGFLQVGSKVRTQYDQADVNLLLNVGRQIGKALEVAELYAQMQQRLKELEGLAQLSAACNGMLDPTEVARIAARWTHQLLACDLVIVRLLQGNQMRLMAYSAHRAVQLRDEMEMDDVFGPIVTQPRPLILDNVEQANLPDPHRQGFLSVGIRAIAVLPMQARDRVLGALAVTFDRPHAWQTNEINLAQTIANHIASAMDSAQLFQNVLSEQRKVQAIFDSGLSGLFATDAEGRITMFNHAAESITGWSHHEVFGKKWGDVFRSVSQDSPKPLINDALYRKKTVFVQEGRKIHTRDGRVIPVAKAVAPLLDEKGNVTGAVGAFWDLSREQAAEIAREELLKEIAHQLRSPLTAILSAMQLLERPNLSPERRAEMWAALKRDGQRLRRFADQILDLQATLKSEQPLSMEPLSIAALVRTLVRSFRTQKSRHRFHVQATSKNLLALADEWRVENVLRNLLDNAIIYSPPATLITITIKPTTDQMILIAVRDQGPGISREDQTKIFEPFYRSARAQKRNTYGHGLGLAIAKRNVEEMGGRIWVESKEGHGATFYFTLRRYR